MSRLRLACALAAALAAAAPAAADTYVYVHDRSATHRVHAFALAKDGGLAPLLGTPFAVPDPIAVPCRGLCQTMAADAKSHRLFTSGESGVSVWDVGEDGSLALVPGSPFGATGPLVGVAAVRAGKRVFVYAAEYDLDRLRGFEVQPDGTLAELPTSPVAAGDGPSGIAAARRLLFATSEDGRVASYVVGKDGALAAAPGSPLPLDPPPIFVFNARPDAKGKRLYVVDDGFDDPVDDANDLPVSVYAFRVSPKTAGLTPVAGSPFATSMPTEAMVGLPDAVVGATGASTAKKLVVAVGYEAGASDLQVFEIGKKGVLAPLGAVQDSGLDAEAHALDPKGRWLLLASDQELRAYAVDRKTGALTPGDSESFPSASESNAVVVLSR